MSSLPVWRLRHRIWLPVMAEHFEWQQNHMITCVRHGLKIICVKFRDDRVNYVATGKIVWILRKSKMAAKFFYWFEKLAVTINGTIHSMTSHWNCVAIPHISWDISQNRFLLIIAPPSGQISRKLLWPLAKGSILIWPSLVMIRQSVDKIWAHFLFGGFAFKFDGHLPMNEGINKKSIR